MNTSTRQFRIHHLLTAVLLIAYSVAYSQEDDRDTVLVADTLEVPIRVMIIPDLGTIGDGSLKDIRYLDFIFLEYTSAASNLEDFPGIFSHDRDAVGQPTVLSAFGTGWRSIGTMIDGRPAIEPLMGIYDFTFFPTEFIGKIEFLPPWRSFLYQRNAVGAGFNIVSQSYVAPTPYTKIRYSEGQSDYSQIDVILSQDIAPGLNLMAGIQRQFFGAADLGEQFRGRFPNMNHRGLNYRSKLRWNLPSVANLALTYSHLNTFTGLSGGIDIVETESENFFDERQVVMRNTDAFNRVYRHDLYMTSGLLLLPDSADVTTISLHYNNVLREYRDEENRINPNGITVITDHRSLLYGFDIKQWFSLGPIRFHTGINSKESFITRSNNTGKRREREYGAFARSILEPIPLLRINVMIREDWLRRSNYTSYGMDATVSPMRLFSVTGGAVRSFRHPTIQDLYWQDSTVTRAGFLLPEQHDLVFLETKIGFASTFFATIGASHRIIFDPIIYRPGTLSRIYPDVTIAQETEHTIRTAYVRSMMTIGDFTIDTKASLYTIKEEETRIERLPEYDLQGQLIFRRKLFKGSLDLHISLEALYFSRYTGEDFNPETFFMTDQQLAYVGPAGTLNGKIIGKIGNAYIHITYKNITGQDYMRTPFYPMLTGYIRFGVIWEFLN
jgi:hypothetical protein